MPNFNGDVVFVDGSGQVRSQSGDLTLRADSTNARDVIVGSGRSLRPDRDVTITLGTPDLRWLDVRTSGANIRYLKAYEGELGAIYSVDFNSVFLNPITIVSGLVAFQDANITVGSNSDFATTSDSDATFGGRADFFGITVFWSAPGFDIGISSDFFPQNDLSYMLGKPTKRWSRVQGGSGVFNVLSAPTSGTYIGVEDADLLPTTNAQRALGSLGQRWARIHAASGIFNTIGAPTSGTFIDSAASIVPNRTNIYSLGTSAQRWANIFATSGTIVSLLSSDIQTSTLSANTAAFEEVTINTKLTAPLDAGGSFAINQNGSWAWDAMGYNVTVINMTDWDWGSANLSSIGVLSTTELTVANGADINGILETANIIPQFDRLYAIGTSALRYSRMHAASGIFNTLAPATSGTYLNVIGSLVPERDAIYSLGTSSLRWANIYAVSGVFSSRPTVNGSGVVLQGEVPANSAIALNFTPANGTDFVLVHGLGTTDWTWSAWRTDVTPIKAIIPTEIIPSGVNAVRIQLDSPISGRVVLTAAGASGVATGAVGMFQTTIDFGSTPIQESGFLVTNAFVTPSSILMAQVAYDTTSSKDLDEMEMDGLDLKLGQVNFGGFTIYARGLDGPVHGEFKINYSLANI